MPARTFVRGAGNIFASRPPLGTEGNGIGLHSSARSDQRDPRASVGEMFTSRFKTRGSSVLASSRLTKDIGTRDCGGSDRVPISAPDRGTAGLESDTFPALMAAARADNPRSHTMGLRYRSTGRSNSETVAAGVIGVPFDRGRAFDGGRGTAPISVPSDQRTRSRVPP
jgi:hypothetical protein